MGEDLGFKHADALQEIALIFIFNYCMTSTQQALFFLKKKNKQKRGH